MTYLCRSTTSPSRNHVLLPLVPQNGRILEYYGNKVNNSKAAAKRFQNAKMHTQGFEL
jgi:hypothetical protein